MIKTMNINRPDKNESTIQIEYKMVPKPLAKLFTQITPFIKIASDRNDATNKRTATRGIFFPRTSTIDPVPRPLNATAFSLSRKMFIFFVLISIGFWTVFGLLFVFLFLSRVYLASFTSIAWFFKMRFNGLGYKGRLAYEMAQNKDNRGNNVERNCYKMPVYHYLYFYFAGMDNNRIYYLRWIIKYKLLINENSIFYSTWFSRRTLHPISANENRKSLGCPWDIPELEDTLNCNNQFDMPRRI